MWLNFKKNDLDLKVNLSKIEVMVFDENVIVLYTDYTNDSYVAIRREHNKNFDEILEKLINL